MTAKVFSYACYGLLGLFCCLAGAALGAAIGLQVLFLMHG